MSSTRYIRATVELPGGAATDVWVPNTWEHEQALRRLIDAVGYGAVTEAVDHVGPRELLSGTATDLRTLGPPECRITWHEDDAPPDPGDIDGPDFWEAVTQYGHYGCVVELRPPACACCGVKQWEHAASLWGIIGDETYHRLIERELLDEVRHG